MEHNNNNNNKKFLELVADYKIVFGSDEGKRVLSDLEKRCHEFATTHQKGDSHETAYLEGQRSVLIFIKNALKQTNS
jgi:hypothetical protein